MFSASAGRSSAQTAMDGAQFSAPGFGQSNGVSFGTSINNGNVTSWSLSARQPLYSAERSGDFGAASNTSRQQMIGLQLNLPLYTGGYRSAKLEESLRLQDKADAEIAQSQQQIAQQIRAAWLGLQIGTARLSALAQAVTASQARLDATRLGRQVGDRTTLDLLNAENDASSADLALLQARIDVLQNRLRLQALAGQLDETRLQTVNVLLQP